MKQYTRRDALKLFGIGTVTIAGFGLAGCSGSGEGVKNASEPVPASQAFGQAGVWMVYDGDKQIGKDVAIEEVLSFDGNGNVASYQCKSLTFGDLDGLSDDEIVELAKQQDEAAFNAAKTTTETMASRMCPRKTEPRSSRRTRPRWTTRRMLSTLQTKDRHSMKLPLIKNPRRSPIRSVSKQMAAVMRRRTSRLFSSSQSSPSTKQTSMRMKTI